MIIVNIINVILMMVGNLTEQKAPTGYFTVGASLSAKAAFDS